MKKDKIDFASNDKLREKLLDSIETTGFTLEYEVSQILTNNGWIVKTGKYYVDDIDNKPREIDIIAFKIEDAYRNVYLSNNKICTVLIISCKKESCNDICCFYTKEKQLKDNLHFNFKTANKFINFLIKNNDISISSYLENIKQLKNTNLYNDILTNEDNQDVFASQLFKYTKIEVKGKGQGEKITEESITKQDDKPIYSSIQSVLKSMFYEFNKISNKQFQNNNINYFFHLLSVFDVENFLQISFSDEGKKIENIDDIKYTVNNIIYNTEVTTTIHFIQKKKFEELAKQYTKLHNCNCYFFNNFRKYFDQIFNNMYYFFIYFNLIKDELITEILEILDNSLIHDSKLNLDKHDLSIRFSLIDDISKVRFWVDWNILYDKDYVSIKDFDLKTYSFNTLEIEINLLYNKAKDIYYRNIKEINCELNETSTKSFIIDALNQHFFGCIDDKLKINIFYDYCPF